MDTINPTPVLRLPVQERIRIVEAIWDSVADAAHEVDLQPWRSEELDRRVAEREANPRRVYPGRRSSVASWMLRTETEVKKMPGIHPLFS